jgi:TM2 domain-containing membrane protein YozV
VKGQVLIYDQLRATGLISGENGERYSFAGLEWKSAPQQLRAGAKVDFAPSGGAATAIYLLPGEAEPRPAYAADDKSNIAAGLLALFLGWLGIHKFYLGYNSEGVILLVSSFLSFILLIVLIGFFGLLAISVICLVEGIIYLTKSPEEFRATYVTGRKPWF